MPLSVLRFIPPIALMAFLYYLSAQPGLSTGLSFDLVLRKIGHVGFFGLLALLWWWAFRYTRLGLAAGLALAYAALDEYHQSFVPDRSGSPRDVAINAIGIGLAVLLARRLKKS